jgi:uncharacterized protein YkwD
MISRLARPRASLVAALLLVFALATTACLPLSADERLLSDRTNALRQQAGVPTLYQHDLLVERARIVAADLAARGVLQHSDLSKLGLPWQAAGENIGRGTTSAGVSEGLVASKVHRSNMLLSTFTHQGVGSAVGSDGRVYVVQIFCRC